MSVATQLGLADPEGDLLGQARTMWPTWCAHNPCLNVVDDLLDLPPWLRAADPEAGDSVLRRLAELASPTAGDDVVAAGALAWLLLPGACLMAHRLRSLTSRIDEVVAAQLWLEIRSFPWQRQRKVAANIVMNTRRGVLRELGVGQSAREADPTWARSLQCDPDSPVWAVMESRQEPQSRSAAELADVLAWALERSVIDETDRDLLLTLAEVADRAGVSHNGRGRSGLCSHTVATTVASLLGVSPITIRRRATAALSALAEVVAAAEIPASA